LPIVSLVIPDEIVRATHMSPEELQVEIAVLLFENGKLTLGQAARLAGIAQPTFQHLLGRRKIPLHYDVEDFRRDLQTLKDLDVT
jgi:predicted HTH domain antitoxin